jgi:iron-sulfur cluster assembly accessory protein
MNITITPAAEKFIRRMITFGGGNNDSGFRLALKPGGCSGLSYDFSIESEPKPGDTVIEGKGIRVFVPQESTSLLDGVVIGCEDNFINTGLTFTNPNAGQSCGCGSSFKPA